MPIPTSAARGASRAPEKGRLTRNTCDVRVLVYRRPFPRGQRTFPSDELMGNIIMTTLTYLKSKVLS